MLELSSDAYLWLKALHVISVIAWMAGLFYLPRLFVYHTATTAGSEASETFKIMERRLLRVIMTPAMIASFAFGGVLLVEQSPSVWSAGWTYVKLAAVLGLTVLHVAMARWRQDFAADRNPRPGRFYRVVNEVPTVLMIVIVVMAVVKPF